MNPIKIVSRDEWLALRRELLQKEKNLTRLNDELARERRGLPWVHLDQPYSFEGPTGRVQLSDLFAGRDQLVVYHFMFGPGWKEGCPSCSLLADHLDGSLVHLRARDVSLVLVSRAPYAELAAFKARMGWRLPWYSSFDSDFNRDFRVSFSKEEIARGEFDYNYGKGGFPSEEAPGLSVFARDASGTVYHTYSSYARGGEPIIAAYHVLDMVPKGRDEAGLPWPMAWVRHHDRYGLEQPTSGAA